MNGTIKLTTNKVTGKQYICQTMRTGKDLERYFGSGRKLKKAIKKYGKENFTSRIIQL